MNTDQQELLSQLSDLINANKKREITSLDTLMVYKKFKEAKQRTASSISHTDSVIFQFARSFPNLPDKPILIDEYLENLKNLRTNKPIAFATKVEHYTLIHSLLAYAIAKFDFINYLDKFIKPKSKLSTPERIIWNEEIINYLILSFPSDYRKLVLSTLIDSDCRIGELGITQEHDCLRVNRVHPDIEQIEVYGKTGYHKKHCSASLCDLLIQISNPTNGAIFWTKRAPNGMTSRSLTTQMWTTFSKLLKNTNAPTSKYGSHTIRHSIASFLADNFHDPMLVQKFLSHSDYKMSQKYVHESEERKRILPSPLQMITDNFNNNPENKVEPLQKLLISEEAGSIGTSLVPYNPDTQQVEQVEATVDITAKMFKDIPEDFISARVELTKKDLINFKKAFLFISSNLPSTSPLPGELARRFNMFFRKSKS